MIEVLLGSKNAERVLIYIFAREEGYAREIARFFNTDLKSIQNQLDKLEADYRSERISRREYEARKAQIEKGSIIY